MKMAYAVPTVADLGNVIARTLGTVNEVSLEPSQNFRPIATDTASANESADGLVVGTNSSKSLLSRSNE